MTKATYSNITVYAPLQSSYGFLPASKWPDFMPSLIWTATTDRGSRIVTWEGARLDRDVAQPVSFQAEFHGSGEVTYRYDTFPTNGVATGVFRNGVALAFNPADPQSFRDFPGTFTITASGEGCSASATVIVYAVDYLTIESFAFPTDQEIVHFPGMEPHPFDPRKMISAEDPNPDLHQPFFYMDAQTDFVVPPFTVDLIAHFTPNCISDDDITCLWDMVSEGENGVMTDADKTTAHFTPTTDGGVYRFTFSCDSLTNSEANLVLPLAGSSVDDIMVQTLAKADTFCATAKAKYSSAQLNSRRFGKRWFVNDGNGDFRGRPDNSSAHNKTVRYYNQVNDETGLGAVATWSGLPIRTAKLSNFVVGYACAKLGVSSWRMNLAQAIGTANDRAAQQSWNAGVSVAAGADYGQTVLELVSNAWDKADIKNRRLWPNDSSTDNFRTYFVSPNERFISIGFVEETP